MPPIPHEIRIDETTEKIPVYHFHVLPSTNQTAKEFLLETGKRIAVTADRQTEGRGRLGRNFFSEGGIYLSCILPAQELSLPVSLLTCAAAAAVCRTITAEGFDAKIKWVNDILMNGKKICGILTEAISEGNSVKGYVAGIGINAGNMTFPDELSDIAGTLPCDIKTKKRLTEAVIHNFYKAVREKPEAIVSYCTEKSCVIGKPIRFFGAATGHGTAIGLNTCGGLIVQKGDGNMIVLTGGEISVRTI